MKEDEIKLWPPGSDKLSNKRVGEIIFNISKPVGKSPLFYKTCMLKKNFKIESL